MLKDYVHLHLIIFMWGFTAILAEYASLPALELVFYRTGIAAALVGLWFAARGRSLRLPRREVWALLGTGFVITAHWATFFAASKISVSVCLVGLATASLWTAILDPLFNRGKIKLFELVLGLGVVVGLYIIYRFEALHLDALLLGILSAFFAALFSVFNGKFTKKHGHMEITFYEMLGAFLACLVYFPLYSFLVLDGAGPVLAWQNYDWLWVFMLAVPCTVYAYAAVVELMRRLSVFATNLSINMEPVYGILMAALLLNEYEKLSPQFYMGTSVILLMVFAYPLLRRRFTA